MNNGFRINVQMVVEDLLKIISVNMFSIGRRTFRLSKSFKKNTGRRTYLPDDVVGIESIDYLNETCLIVVLKPLIVSRHIMSCHPCRDVGITFPTIVIHLGGLGISDKKSHQ